jgi:putative ABC transport system permease protein
MWRLTVRSFRAQWRRLSLTALSVVVGVASVTASFVLADSLGTSINQAIESTTRSIDIQVKPAGAPARFGVPTVGLPEQTVATVENTSGVKAVYGAVQGFGQFLNADGTAPRGDFTGVGSLPSDPEAFDITLLDGRLPTGPADAVVDSATARTRRLQVGDPLQLAVQRGVADFTVSGIARLSGSEAGGFAYVGVSDAKALELVGQPGVVNDISVVIDPGTDVTSVADRLSKKVGPTVDVLTRDELLGEAASELGLALTILTSVLLGFAAVTLFVSAFLIWNTFNIVLAQRTRELALVRAVGGSTRQVATTVIGEGLLVGACSSVIGLAVGIAGGTLLQRALTSLGVGLPDAGVIVEPRTAVVAVAIGMLVTLVSLIGPARRATRIPPVAALGESAVERPTRHSQGVLAACALAAGVALLATGPMSDLLGPWSLVAGLVGATLVFVSTVSLSRFLVRPVISLLALAPARYSLVHRLARGNAVRTPRRTAVTAAALMVGVALVTTTLVAGESLKSSFGGSLRDSVRADAVVSATGVTGISEQLQASLAATPGVTAVVPFNEAEASLQTTLRPQSWSPKMTVAPTRELASVFDVGLSSGRLPRGAGELALQEQWARDRGLDTGARLQLVSAGKDRVLRVSGLYKAKGAIDDVLLEPAAAAGLAGTGDPARLVFIASDRPIVQVLAKQVKGLPGVEVQSRAAYVEAATERFDVVLAVVNALLLLSVLVAGLGIANTLALSVLERRHELGLLRAVGMSRRKTRRMVRAEGLYTACLGGLLGVVLGFGFAVVVVAALPANVVSLAVPVVRLAGVLVVSALLGVVASALPAWSASRLDVLAAIAQE